jgi:hypothetical protein
MPFAQPFHFLVWQWSQIWQTSQKRDFSQGLLFLPPSAGRLVPAEPPAHQ